MKHINDKHNIYTKWNLNISSLKLGVDVDTLIIKFWISSTAISDDTLTYFRSYETRYDVTPYSTSLAQ